ncbi:MAG: APC family permease [Fusobacteriaceae bacterium]
MSKKLEARYGFPVALATVIGIVIGIGIFFKSQPVLKATGGNPELALTAWIIGGVITIISGLVAVEVGAAFPETGGMITWIKKLYGEKMGFIVGWTQTIIYTPAITAAQAYFFSIFLFLYLNKTVPDYINYIVAFAGVTFVYIINIYTRKGGGYIQTVSTAIKILPLLAIGILGLFYKNNPAPFIMSQEVVSTTSGNAIKLVGMALVPVMFAYDGWVYVGTIAGDIKNAKKNLPRAILIGIAFITFCYACLVIGTLRVFPAEVLMKQDGLGEVAKVLFGSAGSKLILLGITISAFGAFNGNSLVATRLPYSLAIDGKFIKGNYFAEINPKHNQPVRSSWFMYFVTITILLIMWITKDPETLSNIPVAIFFLFYILVFCGTFILRKKFGKIENSYRTPLFPLLPVLAIIGGIYILYSAFVAAKFHMLISLAIAALGLIIYKRENK